MRDNALHAASIDVGSVGTGNCNDLRAGAASTITRMATEWPTEAWVSEFLPAFEEVQAEQEVLGPVKFGLGPIKKAFEGLDGSVIWAALQKIHNEQADALSQDVEKSSSIQGAFLRPWY